MVWEDLNQEEPPKQDAGESLVITREEVEKRAGPSMPKPVPEVGPVRAVEREFKEEPSIAPAGFWLRLVAKILDLIVVLVPFGLVFALLTLAGRVGWFIIPWNALGDAAVRVISGAVAVYLASYTIYSIVSHAAHGKTIGKCICGIRVLPSDEVRDGELYYFARFVVAVLGLSILGAGHITAAFRSDKRALHDIVVGSRVIKG